MKLNVLSVAVVFAISAAALTSPAAAATYSSQAAFLAANPGLGLTSFTGQTSGLGDYLPTPATLNGLTFTGTQLRYVSTNFWGSKDSLLDDQFSGNINVSFAASSGVGFYFGSNYGDGTEVNFTAFNGLTPVFSQTLIGGGVDTSFLYFGVDGVGPITGFTLDSSVSGGFSSVAEISANGGTVPEPATWALMISGFAMTGFAARRRRTVAAA